MRSTVAIMLLVACGDPPPLSLKYALTPGPSEVCISQSTGNPATSCADVDIPCDAVLSIRILSPSDPTAPYISVCKTITGRRDLCSIGAIDLPQPAQPIPEQTLEVQVAVYALSTLDIDADGQPICPTTPKFSSSDNLPIALLEPCTPADDPSQCPPQPAIGGRAYYRPGDTKTVVELGCNDLTSLTNPICHGDKTIQVTATVIDFDTGVSVASQTADLLAVSIGEPKSFGGGPDFVLNATDARPLERTAIGPVPAWGAGVNLSFMQIGCLQVLEETPASTSTLVCQPVPPTAMQVDIVGRRLSKQMLAQIIKAIDGQSLTDPPFALDKGLVVGIIRDKNLNPVPNIVVTTVPASTIEYLSADLTRFVAGGTSTSGIFLSTDAPYGTAFSISGNPPPPSQLGGLVNGKVTIVDFELPDLTGQ